MYIFIRESFKGCWDKVDIGFKSTNTTENFCNLVWNEMTDIFN